MKTKLLIWSIVYFVGIILLVVSGLQPFNWVVYAGIVIGIAGIIFAIISTEHKEV